MTLDFISLYQECAGQPWSMFDNDPEDVEDFESAMRISINKAISTIWNLYPWKFRKETYTFKTKIGKNTYNAPDGIICKKVVSSSTKYDVRLSGKRLEYITNYDDIELEEGLPDGFYLEDETIYLNKIPDKIYDITVHYLISPYALSEDGVKKHELEENNDYINIKEKYESKFKNCVISLAMMYAIAEETDENYSAYQRQYDDAMQVLLDACNDGLRDKYIVW